MDAAIFLTAPSVAQFPLIGILLGFLGAWMITFLLLALRSPSRLHADSQQERVRTAPRSQVAASEGEASQRVKNTEEVTQIAS